MKNKFINGNLLVLTSNRELYLLNAREHELVAQFNNLGPINGMISDSDNVIFATTNGLFKYDLECGIGSMIPLTANTNWTKINKTPYGFLAIGKRGANIIVYEQEYESKFTYLNNVDYIKYYNFYRVSHNLYIFVSDSGVYTMTKSTITPGYCIIKTDDIKVRESELLIDCTSNTLPLSLISMISIDDEKFNYISDNTIGRYVNDGVAIPDSHLIQNSNIEYSRGTIYNSNNSSVCDYADDILHAHNSNLGRYIFVKEYYYYYMNKSFTFGECYDSLFDHTVMHTATISPEVKVLHNYTNDTDISVCILPLNQEYYENNTTTFKRYPNINEVLKTGNAIEYKLYVGMIQHDELLEKRAWIPAPNIDLITDFKKGHSIIQLRNPHVFKMKIRNYQNVKNRSAKIDTVYHNSLINFVSKFGTHFPVHNDDDINEMYYPIGLCLTLGGDIIPITNTLSNIPVNYLWYDELRNLIVSKQTPLVFNVFNYIEHNKRMIDNGTPNHMIYSYIIFENVV